MLIFVMTLGLVSNVISDKSDSLRKGKREVIMSCVNERTQATEPCDGAQAMLEGFRIDKMEDGWVIIALLYKGKVMQEYECSPLCNFRKQQLDESMAIVQVSEHLHRSPGMPNFGKLEGPSHRTSS